MFRRSIMLRRSLRILAGNKHVLLLSMSTCSALVLNSCRTFNQPTTMDEFPTPSLHSTTLIDNKHWNGYHFTIEYFGSLIRWILRYTALSLQLTASMMTLPVLLLGDKLHDWWWSFLRANICSAGPSFIKFAQWAATRPDLFSGRVCAELSLLQSQTATHSWKHTEAVLRDALGPNWSRLVRISESNIIGSGSVAQVYKANISTEDGRHVPVAIKVLHPLIRESVEADLYILRSAAQAIESIGSALIQLYESLMSSCRRPQSQHPLVCLSMRQCVDEFSSFMRSQLDMQAEEAALKRLHDNFDGSKRLRDHVIIPCPLYLYRDSYNDEVVVFNSTSRSNSNMGLLNRYKPIDHPDILIETLEEGVPMIEVLQRGSSPSFIINAPEASHDRYIADLGLDIILKMVFEDNFVHADLHAGNILVRYEYLDDLCTVVDHSTRPKLVLLDAGLVVQLQPNDRKNFVSLFKAVLDNDGSEAARLMMEHMSGQGTGTGVLDPEGFQNKMATLVSDVHREGLLLSKVSVGSLLKQVLQNCFEHRVKLESRFVSIVLSIILAEGMGRQLDPSINIIERARPFIFRAALDFVVNNVANDR